MPSAWFAADFHFGHANIIRFCSRPFSTVREMDQAILDRLNASVKTNDILYFLGDFCMGNPLSHTVAGYAVRRSLPCPEITTKKSQAERGVFLARQSGRGFDPRPPHYAVPLCPASLESKQPRIMAPLWAFSWSPSGSSQFALHGCGSRRT